MGSLALVTLHFTLLVVWLLPGAGAPALRRAAHVYVAPLFAQNWWLFAPEPPVVDRRVQVRGLALAAGGGRWTPWVPLTEPLTLAVQRNPLAADNATWILLLNSTYALTDGGGPLRLRPVTRALVLRTWSSPERQPAALVVLERIGARALIDTYPGLRFERLQVRIQVRSLPPFAAPDTGAEPAPPEELIFPPVDFPDELAGRASSR